ncbi:MAG: PEP-CTERM sorting domain-containing protein [Fimbriimonadaceae bacterium]
MLAGAGAQSYILGINASSNGGGIYRIQVSGPNIGQTQLVTSTLFGGQPNGLAYDAATNTAYYMANNRDLVQHNLTTMAAVVVGKLSFNTASATWHNGAYYYHQNNGTQLRRVTMLGSSSASETTIATSSTNLGFGDIASDQSGMAYFSASGNRYLSADLSNPNPTINTISTTHGPQLQLGFSNGILYGISADTDEIFQLDTATGNRTRIGILDNRNLSITDAASLPFGNTGVTGDPVPEPFTMGLAGAALVSALRRRKRSKA